MPIDPMLFKKAHKEDAIKAEVAPSQDETGEIQFTDEGPQEGQTFQEMLDSLNSLIEKETGINSFNIDFVRGYVRNIMTDLKTQPDLDSLLIDRDVHNVLAFIQHVKNDAIDSKVAKKEKKEIKAKKGRLGAMNFNIADMPAGLADLAKFK